MKISLRFLLPTLLLSLSAHAVPIDWRGAFGVDTTLINTYQKTESLSNNSDGSQVPDLAAGKQANASFQTYLFRLNPSIVVNDSATIKGEITNGYGRGGHFGDSGTERKQGGFGNALYYYNTTSESALLLTKLYAELYSDMATWVLGRQSLDWGLGALYSSGQGLWDRHTFVLDGIAVKFRLSNFHIIPHYGVLTSGNSLTRATKTSEFGMSLLYDNPDRDMTLGILYTKRENDPESASSTSVINGNAQKVGASELKITDIYFKKTWSRFTFAAEIPLLNGEMKNLYGNNENTHYSAKALLGQINFKANDRWSFGIHAGDVSGHDGNRSDFKAMFLNPNYQIANILFRYNLFAVADPTSANVFDSYITNTQFFKISTTLTTEKWQWTLALIKAKAKEVAHGGGQSAYNHTKNKLFNSQVAQGDDLGTEFDLNTTYHWNSDVEVGASAAYLSVGDYWAYTDTPASPATKKNSWLLQARAGIQF